MPDRNKKDDSAVAMDLNLNKEGLMRAFTIPGIILLIFISMNSFAQDRIIIDFELCDSETVYIKVPDLIENCYQEMAHSSKQKIAICGEGCYEGLDNKEEFVVNEVPGQDCAGYSFITVNLNENDPSVQFDLLRQQGASETTLSYEARLSYVEGSVKSLDPSELSAHLKLHDDEGKRIAEIYKNQIKDALNKVKNTIQEKTQVNFSDLAFTDFTCDSSFELLCSKDRATHKAPRLHMTGFVAFIPNLAD